MLLADLAEELGVHVNTVREHLEALTADGLVVRTRSRAGGRGRPPWAYALTPAGAEPDVRVRDYAGLATALARHIARTSEDPSGDAVRAGLDWGAELAREDPDQPGAAGAHDEAATRRRVVELVARLGFDPVTDEDSTTVDLRRCPLLAAAQREPEVVCAVHLGIARGAMQAYGAAEPERTTLLPFAAPGVCRLELSTEA